MTNTKLISLAVTAAVLGGLAYLSTAQKRVKTPSAVGKPVLKAVALSDVQRLEVRGDKKLVLESTDEGWVVRSLFGYPATLPRYERTCLN